MRAQTELDRLASARPPLLDRTELVIDRATENQILRQILAAPRPRNSRPRGSRPRNSRPKTIRPAAAIATAAAVVAVAGAGVLVRSAVDRMNSPADQVNSPGRRTGPHRAAAPARLPSLRIMAARTEGAVAAVSRTGILYVRMVYSPGMTTGGTAVLESWTRGIRDREKLLGADGSLQADDSAVIVRGQRVRRFVDYQARTWQTDSIAVGQYGPGLSASQTVAELFRSARPASHLTGDRARRYLRQRAQPHLKVPGAPTADEPRRTISSVVTLGRPMILFTFTYPRPLSHPVALMPWLGSSEEVPGTAGTGDSAGITMCWIDARTYLPVRSESFTPTGRILTSETYRWLSDSPSNRAVLAPAPVPAGFRLTQELAH